MYDMISIISDKEKSMCTLVGDVGEKKELSGSVMYMVKINVNVHRVLFRTYHRYSHMLSVVAYQVTSCPPIYDDPIILAQDHRDGNWHSPMAS